MQKLLNAFGKKLHETFETPPKTMASRNLLKRANLIALLAENLQPKRTRLQMLVKQAEGKARNAAPDLQSELEASYKLVREEFALLAFLYDLRVHGGLAHPPSKKQAAAAATNLDLPRNN